MRKHQRVAVLAGILIWLVIPVSTHADLSGADYERSLTRSEQAVRLGTVVNIRRVHIQGTMGVAGVGVGTVIGGVVGSMAGSGGGKLVAEVTGVITGGITGAVAERSLTAQTGIELTIQFDNGRLAALVQGSDEQFQPGDRVSIIGQPGAFRVTKIDLGSPLYVTAPPADSAPPALSVPGRAPPAGSAPVGSWSSRAITVSNFRWLCPNRQAYYPVTTVCESAWVKVIP
jgi:outer membrane lipoprotein SlyB